MKRFINIGATLLIILALTSLAFYPKIKEKLNEKPKDEPGTSTKTAEKTQSNSSQKVGGDAKLSSKVAVEVMVVAEQTLEDKVQTTGSLLANEEVEIRTEVSGRLTKLYFNEGDHVKKGALLFQINDEDLRARLRKLQYNKKLAEDNEARQKILLEREAISQREYDISVNSVNTIQADIEDLQAQIAKYSVRAPFEGSIGLRYISEGSYISPSTRIASLTNVNPIKLDFAIPAKYSGKVQRGSRVYFDEENGQPKYIASIYAIDPKIDPQTRTLQLRAKANNPQNRLKPGAFVKINIVLAVKGKAIMIPTEAVIPEAAGAKVFVVQNGTAKPKKVKLGFRADREVEVLEGLAIGDSLIRIGTMQVKPDAEVEVLSK
jgi:membrane fusion protein, multidrug efflux system